VHEIQRDIETSLKKCENLRSRNVDKNIRWSNTFEEEF
jgi:hypothetical protein